MKINHAPAEPDDVHKAILSGLLSHVGMRDAARREYVGARNARFALWPGSGVKGGPSWAMVAELVETSRLWGRTVARIDPRWIEPLAEHLVRRSYDEPRWDRKRAQVVATERVTLYGLPVVAGRTVGYGRIDPQLSRELFIRRALVEGEWDARHRFLEANRQLVEEVRELEDRARRRDILVGDEAIFEFYAARIPAGIVSGAHFDRWWRDERRNRPDLLTFTRELLVNPDAAGSIAGRPGGLAPGRHHAAAELPLRPRVGARRRDRPRAAQAAAPAGRAGVRVARAGVPGRARHSADPLAAQGAAQAAGARAGRGRGGAGAPGAAAQAAAGGAGRADRAPARRAHPAGRLGPRAAAGAPADDVQHRGRRGRACSRPARTSTRCASRSGRGCAPRWPRPRARWSARARPTGRSATSRGSSRCPAPGQAVRAYPALVDEGETVGVRALETPDAQRPRDVRRHAAAAAADVPVAAAAGCRRGSANREQLALASAPHGSRPRRARRLHDRRRLRADGRGRRPGVRRGGVRPPARPRRRLAGRDHD